MVCLSWPVLLEMDLTNKPLSQSCAATLAQHPDKFRVTLIEKAPVTGGQAISIPLDETKFGASWLNNGVQGGSLVRRIDGLAQ